MQIQKISPRLLTFILLAAFCLIVLIIRVALPYHNVFSGEWIKFTTNDAYYQMRIVDSIVYNFPRITQSDPYLSFPDLGSYGNIHFFNWLLAAIIWIISLGKFNQHVIDVIGVYFPTVLAALTVIPVYFIGRELFGKWAGMLAAALTAILPGEFLIRSLLGSTDQHIAEILFSTVSVLFLVFSIKEMEKLPAGTFHLTKNEWKILIKPLIYSCLGGLFLAMYLVTWQGGLFFVLIILIYLVIQFIIDHLRHEFSIYLGITSFVFILVAAVIFFPSILIYEVKLVVITAALIPLFLTGLSALFSKFKLKRGYYPLTIAILGGLFVFLIYAKEPGAFHNMVSQFSTLFLPQGYSASTTSEMLPFLSVSGKFSTQVAWENFTTNFFLIRPWPIPGLGIISFFIVVWLFIKNHGRQKNHLLLIIWTIIMLIATLTQRRFAYYLTINVALLSGYLSWQFIWLGGIRKFVTQVVNKVESRQEKSAREKRRKKRRENQGTAIYYVRVVGVIIIVFILFFLFNILMVKQEASVTPLAPSNAWEEGLSWLKVNTPEPLDVDSAYYEYHVFDFTYPVTAYSIASWWDYGYWITRIAHRIPVINPSQDPKRVAQVANLFTSSDENSADLTLKDLSIKYVICDTAMITTKFWGITTWAGSQKEDFFEDYYVAQGGKLIEATVFYPKYYESMLVRLFNFDGKAVAATEPTVITFVEKIGQDGNPYKQIIEIKNFSSYEEAMNYISQTGPANHRLVSTNPFASPIPLESVQNYHLVFSSKAINNTIVKGVSVPQVKIFEYAGN